MTFLAETEMKRLLNVKGDTGGLNTGKLDGRNCHIWSAPLISLIHYEVVLPLYMIGGHRFHLQR